MSNSAFVPETVLLHNASVLFVKVDVTESYQDFIVALMFAHVTFLRTLLAALSIKPKASASTGVVFPLEPCIVDQTFAASVTSAPSSTLIAANSEDLLIEPNNPTTDCTASVWSCLLQFAA